MRNVLKHFIKYYCKPFAKETTIHGVSFLNAPGLHPLERLFWLIVILSSATGATSLVISNWNRYVANPTVISIQKDFRNWKNLLPSVTGCFSEKYNNESIARYIEETWGLTVKDSKYEYYANFVKTVANVSYHNLDDFAKYEIDSKLNNVNFFDLAKRVHPELSGTLVTFDVKHKSDFTLIMTEIGICFTVNSKFANLLAVNRSKVIQSDALGDKDMLKCHYLNGLCYARYDSDPLAPINFYIHSYLDIVHATSDRPFHVGESQELEINYLMEETSPSTTLRNLYPSQRRCRFDDEPLHDDVPAVYSPTICRIACRYKLVMQKCKCRPFFYHFMQGKMCNITGMLCVARYVEDLVSLSKFKCHCPQPCHMVSYLPLTPKLANWTSGYFDQRLTFRWGLLHPTTKYRRDVLFSFEDLVVSLGGSLSLFLGISFISLIEIVFFILNYVVRYFPIRKAKTSVRLKPTRRRSIKMYYRPYLH